MRAVVLREPGRVAVEEIDRPSPGMGEILVRLEATGVCHTDKTMATGGIPAPVPMVLGHEGAGVVEELGPGVHNVRVGDHVVLSIVGLSGTYAGSLSPQVDIPGALTLYRQGRLPLDLLVTETISLEDVPRLMDPDAQLPSGRAIVLFD